MFVNEVADEILQCVVDEEIESWDDVIENCVTVYEERLTGMNTLITTGKFKK